MHYTVIKCAPLDSPSRYEHRRNHRQARAQHLGTFEGERLSRCRSHDESYTLVQAMLSLLAVTFAVLGTGMALYGMMGG